MAVVPRIGNPSVDTAPLPNARVAVDLNPDAYGVNDGRALQQTGRQISDAGQGLLNAAVHIQEQQNTDMVFQAEAKLSEDWLAYQNEATQRRGTAAFGLSKDTAAWFDKRTTEIAKDLPSQVKRIYDQRALQRRLSGIEWAAGYERRERDASLEQSLAASLAAAQNEAAANPSPDAVATGVKNIEKNLRATAQVMGWDATYLDQRILEEQGKLHVAVINNMVESDPRGARAYYAEHKNQIPGTVQDQVGKIVDKSVKVLDAQDYADAAIASGASETEVLRRIRANYQGDDEELIVAHVRSRFNERDAEIARAEKANRDTVWNAIAEAGGDMTKVPTKTLSALDAYDQQRAFDYAERLRNGNDSTTDWSAYTNFMMLPDAEKAKQDPSKLRPVLGNTEYKQVIGIIDALKNPTVKPMADTATPTQQANMAADALGLTGEGMVSQRGMFTSGILDRVEAFKTANKREPSYSEVKDMIKEVTDLAAQRPEFFKPEQKPDAAPTATLESQLSTAHDMLDLGGAKKAAERGAFDTLVTNEVDLYRNANGGRDPDYAAVQGIIKRATKETVVEKEWWPDSTVTPLSVEVPADDRSKIEAEFMKSRSRKPTELEVREAYIKVQAKKAAQ